MGRMGSAIVSERASGHEQPFSHEALLYTGMDGFLDATVPFLRDGVVAGDDILVVVNAEKIDRLGDELGADAQHIRFADMAAVGANPARIIPAWLDFASRRRPEMSLRGIGEPIWAERSAAELVECQRHEALLNLAFADTPAFRLLCPYDTTALDPAVIEEAHTSHPLVRQEGTGHPSRMFGASPTAATHFGLPLPEPTVPIYELGLGAGSVAMARRLVEKVAGEAGLAPARVTDVLVSVSELATNALRHGGGQGRLRVWLEPSAMVCEVQDNGRIDDPLVGRSRPRADAEGGRGLWLVTQMCDLVQVRTLATGNVVRVRVDRS